MGGNYITATEQVRIQGKVLESHIVAQVGTAGRWYKARHILVYLPQEKYVGTCLGVVFLLYSACTLLALPPPSSLTFPAPGYYRRRRVVPAHRST